MRKVKLYIATSLDGFIAGPNEEIDWLFHDQDYGYTDFYASIDTTLMGRLTYQKILTFGDFPYPDKTNYVFTRSLNLMDTENVQFITDDPVSFVKELQQQPGQHIWLVGGGQLNTTLLNVGLIDEIVCAIHPTVLGSGVPVFAEGANITSFKTVNTQQYSSGMVIVTLLKE